MLGGSFFRDFDEDQFFAGHHQQMQQMHQLMSPFNMPERGQHRRHEHARRHQPRQDIVPFGMFGADFGFGDMFRNMRRMMDDMHRSFQDARVGIPNVSNPDGHMYTQSSFMSYSNTGQGPPKVYQASSSTRQVPGGVRETRRTVRDTQSGVEKMAVGHHINDQSHIIERSRNRNTGEMNENQEYVNLDEEEAPTFDREWQDRTRQVSRGLDYHRSRHNPIGNGRPARQPLALPEARPRSRSHRDRE